MTRWRTYVGYATCAVFSFLMAMTYSWFQAERDAAEAMYSRDARMAAKRSALVAMCVRNKGSAVNTESEVVCVPKTVTLWVEKVQ